MYMTIWTIVTVAILLLLKLSSTIDAASIKVPDKDDVRMYLSSMTVSSHSVSLSSSVSAIEKAQVVDGSSSCSVSDVEFDSCEFRLDSECDAGIACPSNTDCIDCDPCYLLHGNSCSSCSSDPSCAYCEGIEVTTQTPFGTCTTVEIAEVFPDFCWLLSGNTGDFDGTTFAFGSTNCTDTGKNETDTCDVLNDLCSSSFDGTCDTKGDSPLCSTGTDCYDCDPCKPIVSDAINASIFDSNEICELCSAAGCQYCTFPSVDGGTVALCTSPSIAFVLSDICTLSGGTSYTDTCDGTGTGQTPAPSPKNTNITLSTCDYSNDLCQYTQDKVCDVNSATVLTVCPQNSDCLDCDPCQALRFEGCDSCVAAGCYWCASDALCLSTNPSIKQNSTRPQQLTCSNPGDFVQTCPLVDGTAIFSDPLYEAQNWVYEQIGVVDVWKSGITGAGIGIRINDDGVDDKHVEFSTKFDVQSSCSVYTPVVPDDKHNHGTTCASIAGGSGNNRACSVGIAPNATISSCRVIKTEYDDVLAVELEDSSYFYAYMENMHISSNSYAIPTCGIDSSLVDQGSRSRRLQQCPFISTTSTSPCLATECSSIDWSNPSPSDECEAVISIHCIISFESDVLACTNFLDLFVTCEFNSLSMAQQVALNRGVTEGRNGKGIVYIFAGGNDFDAGADVNFAGYQSSRFSITVGAADKNGKHSSFSNGGAALFITAPGGDLDYYTNNVVALVGGGCTDGGAGTSFAAPVVAGVVALMLEANPNLSWRDVQGVLASTATKVQPADPSWATNGAGLSHSYIYGFGLVNASAAVEKGRSWTYLRSELEIITDSKQVNLTIPEYPNEAITTTITVNANNTYKIESVIVYLDLLHSSRGDLNIVLTSPSGTKSILSPGQRPENSQNSERWRLMTVRNREESAQGDWTLTIVDQSVGDLSSCIDTIGWFTDLGSSFTDEETWDCDFFAALNLCADGAEGPLFSTFFPDAIGLSDPSFAGTDRLTPDVACCACGGGLPASNLTDTLHSWRLVIYGSDPEASIVPNPSPFVPAPTSATSPVASNPSSIASTPPSATSPVDRQNSPLTPQPPTTTSNDVGSTSDVDSTQFAYHNIQIMMFTSIMWIVCSLN